jgi:hypothetical protein
MKYAVLALILCLCLLSLTGCWRRRWRHRFDAPVVVPVVMDWK